MSEAVRAPLPEGRLRPEPRTPNPEPRTPNHSPRTTNHEPRTTNHEPRLPLVGLAGPGRAGGGLDTLLELALPLVSAALEAVADTALLRADLGRLHPRHERALREAERTLPHDGPSVGLRGHVPRELALLVVLRVPQPLRVELVLCRDRGLDRDGIYGLRDDLLRLRAARRVRGGGVAAHVPSVRGPRVRRHGAREPAPSRLVRVSRRGRGRGVDGHRLLPVIRLPVSLDLAARGVRARAEPAEGAERAGHLHEGQLVRVLPFLARRADLRVLLGDVELLCRRQVGVRGAVGAPLPDLGNAPHRLRRLPAVRRGVRRRDGVDPPEARRAVCGAIMIYYST